MKKLIAFLITAFLTVTIFAESEKTLIFDGIGVTMPIIHQKITKDGSRNVFTPMVDFNTVVVNKESGFTWQFDIGVGYATTKDIPFYDKERQHGTCVDFEMGFGYSFIRNDDTVLSLLGAFGLTAFSFKGDKSYYYNDMKLSDSEVFGLNWNLGLEGIFIKSLTEKLAFFGALSARWIWSGDEESKYSKEQDGITYSVSVTREAEYAFAVVPKLGLLWKI